MVWVYIRPGFTSRIIVAHTSRQFYRDTFRIIQGEINPGLLKPYPLKA